MKLTKPERVKLTKRASGRTLRAEDARRARCILPLAEQHPWAQVRDKPGCNDSFIARWSERFESQRLAGLFSRHKGSEARALSAALEARILECTRQAPPDGSTHWSTRKLAKVLKTHHMPVAQVWAKQAPSAGALHGLRRPAVRGQSSRYHRFVPEPTGSRAVFCVDEKSAIQALDRLDPVLPLSPGRAERHGFEYYLHDMLSLFAAFNTKTGEVLGKTTQRHTSAEFVAFLADIVAHQPKGKEIHVIADNLSAHKTKQIAQCLSEHPRLSIHYTPTYSSWLSQVELWFAKIERDVVSRGAVTSVKDLARKLMRYIRQYNRTPKTVKWKYFDPTRRITTESAVTVH